MWITSDIKCFTIASSVTCIFFTSFLAFKSEKFEYWPPITIAGETGSNVYRLGILSLRKNTGVETPENYSLKIK